MQRRASEAGGGGGFKELLPQLFNPQGSTSVLDDNSTWHSLSTTSAATPRLPAGRQKDLVWVKGCVALSIYIVDIGVYEHCADCYLTAAAKQKQNRDDLKRRQC
eukprot:1144453-Pelagomonas_calceolata.AAC.6